MQAYEQEHLTTLRALAPECMVLLKSDGAFPLADPQPVALYGPGARHTVKGGTGSGDVNTRQFVTVEQGLERAGCTITSKAWLDGYQAAFDAARRATDKAILDTLARDGMSDIIWSLGNETRPFSYDLPMDGSGDTAIYVLSRLSGEGADRTAQPGDFCLTDRETREILTLAQRYPRFLLVLNVGGVVDLSPVVDQVGNILLLSQLGSVTGDAFADVLLGRAYPSGKLSATWAPWADYCHQGDFAQPDDTRYREGIYVGYRYFDSVGKSPLFPFGFGLGYTTFAITPTAVRAKDGQVTVEALVRNTGSRPGREVPQLYVGVPAGKLDQPNQTLAAFTKTGELAPGGQETVHLTFPISQLASYDAETSSLLLEQGSYLLYLGSSSRGIRLIGAVHLGRDVVLKQVARVGGEPDFTDWKPAPLPQPALAAGLPVVELNLASIQMPAAAPARPDPAAMALVKGMTDEELADLCIGGYTGQGSDEMVGNAGRKVLGAAGETCDWYTARGIPSLVMADGPAGLRLCQTYGVDGQGQYPVNRHPYDDLLEEMPEETLARLPLKLPAQRSGRLYEQNCTAIPVGMALAQSWNPAAVEVCGDVVGDEMERFGVHLWLAPALNIHRLPLCGRNFEYYSEDPLLSGRIAAAITRGVQAHPGCGVTIKHFCANNQETLRMHSNSVVSPRALRDIYLKGFELAIRDSLPAALMTSYNLVNGEHTSQRPDLLETLLRQEWGYQGLVMSDWVIAGMQGDGHKHPDACASGCIRAGNDLMMPGGPGDKANLLAAVNDPNARYPVTRADLERCAARVAAAAIQLAAAHRPPDAPVSVGTT